MRVFVATVAVLCCSPLAIASTTYHGHLTIHMDHPIQGGTVFTGVFDAQENTTNN